MTAMLTLGMVASISEYHQHSHLSSASGGKKILKNCAPQVGLDIAVTKDLELRLLSHLTVIPLTPFAS
eukprot:1911672-Amphidinium_carterae.1